MLDLKEVEKKILAIDPISLPEEMEGIEAAWLRLPRMPMEVERRPQLTELLYLLQRRIQDCQKEPVLLDIYLQMTQLERPTGSRLISKNGPRWRPEIGMGVWPDREAPRSMSEEDFKNLVPGQRLGETDWPVIRIGAEDEATRTEVLSALAGSGASLVLLVNKEWQETSRKAVSLHLREYITDDVLRSYPMFFPLLDGRSVMAANRKEYEACLPNVLVYLREDLTQRAFLVVSRVPFAAIFPVHFSAETGGY